MPSVCDRPSTCPSSWRTTVIKSMCDDAGSAGKVTFQPQPAASASMTTEPEPSLPSQPDGSAPTDALNELKSALGSTARHSASPCATALSSCAWLNAADAATGVAGADAAIIGDGAGVDVLVGVGVGVLVGVGVGVPLGVGVGVPVLVGVGVEVGVGVPAPFAVDDVPDVQVTEFPSADRVHFIADAPVEAPVGAGAAGVTCCWVAALCCAANCCATSC